MHDPADSKGDNSNSMLDIIFSMVCLAQLY